jgi:hypothetical protein
MPIIPALRKLRQENHEFKDSLIAKHSLKRKKNNSYHKRRSKKDY